MMFDACKIARGARSISQLAETVVVETPSREWLQPWKQQWNQHTHKLVCSLENYGYVLSPVWRQHCIVTAVLLLGLTMDMAALIEVLMSRTRKVQKPAQLQQAMLELVTLANDLDNLVKVSRTAKSITLN